MENIFKNDLSIVISHKDWPLFSRENSKKLFTIRALSDRGVLKNLMQYYSLDGIKLLLSDEYFDKLLEVIKNPRVSKIRILGIKDSSLDININVFINLVKYLNSNNMLNIDKTQSDSLNNKIKTIESMLTLHNLIKDIPTHTTNIQGKDYTVETKDIMDFLSKNWSAEELNSIDSLYGIEPKYFVYVVNDFMKTNKLYARCNCSTRLAKLLSDLRLDNLIDTFSIDEINETVDSVGHIELNPELVDYVFSNMPENYSDIEKAIFVYLKLAKVFTYDAEFYAEQQSDRANEIHSDINRLSTLTPQNNAIVCYEVNKVYAELLRLLGINYETIYLIVNYGYGHANLKFKANDYLIHADMLPSVLGSDMINVKLERPIVGLNCMNLNKGMQDKFNEIQDKVYDEFIGLEPNSYMEDNSFDKWKELLNPFVEEPTDLTIRDRLGMLIEIEESSKLPTIERFVLLDKIFLESLHNSDSTYFTIVTQQKDKTKLKRPTIILTYNEEEKSVNLNENKYILLDEGNWRDIEQEELQALFDSGELELMKYTVPGIKASYKDGFCL